MPDVTHIMTLYASQDSEIISRADTGIVIAQRKASTIIFGPEPNKRRSHVFITPEKAKEYLQTIADDDLRSCKKCAGFGLLATAFRCPACNGSGVVLLDGEKAVLGIRDGEPLIAMPAGAMELPGGIKGLN